jgi:hypothetical protein
MPQKIADIPDEDLKAMMKAIARANGRPLSDERIEIDLPAYRNYLAAVERLSAYEFRVEDEPAFHFSYKPGPAGSSKERPR